MTFWPDDNEKPSLILSWMMRGHLYWLYLLFNEDERQKDRAYKKWLACPDDCDCEGQCRR